MAWNEPGGGKDPWGGGQGGGPPDLDEALRKFRQKFGKFGGGNGSGSGGGGLPGIPGGRRLVPVILVLLFIVWALAGTYQIDEKERAVVLRFGEYLDTVGPGLHWNPPMIDTVIPVRVTEIRQYRNDMRDLMLTEDENIVDLQLAVQYNINDIKDYVLNVRSPEISLEHATQSALRHVVGGKKLNEVISSGREQVGIEIQERLQQYLDNYQTGIQLLKVNILDAKPPAQVKEAYDDVIKAREDQERIISEAQSYANQVVPEARGRGQRLIEEAEGYRSRVIAEAEGEAQRFENLLAEYRNAPEVTRQRLYLETLQDVMTASTKVMVNTSGTDNVFYLPLDKIMDKSPAAGNSAQGLSPAQINTLVETISGRINSETEESQRRGLR